MKTYQGSLAEYVMARRGLLGLTQSQLAEKAGVSKVTINQIERGRTFWPVAETRRKLVAALGGTHAEMIVAAGEITVDEIIEGADAYDPRREKVGPLFPENSPAAKVVEILRSLPDEQAEWVLGTARFAEKQARGVRDDDDPPIVHVNTTPRRLRTG